MAELDTQTTTLQDLRQKLGSCDPFINLPADTLKRLPYLAGIYKGLQILFADPELRQSWVRRPNQDFGGDSALDRMMAGGAVGHAEVRRYLDSWRGNTTPDIKVTKKKSPRLRSFTYKY